MSQTTKIAVAVLVLVALGAAGYFGYTWYQSKNGGGQAVFKEEPAALPSGTSTTDDSLQKDAAAIDAQLKGLDSDSASADAALKESAQVQ